MAEHDLFPLYDAELDTSYLDVFELLPLRPYQRSLIDRSTVSSGPTDTTKLPPSSTTAAPTKPASNTNNLYCKECKKKFNNDATMQNHLKSAKHLAAVKKASGGSKKVVLQAKPAANQEAFINPETTETLRRLDTISDLKSEDAVSAYLGVAKEFYQQKRPLYTANALKALIALNLVDTEYHWLARSAMARLYCLYNRQMDLAYDLYLDILEQRWEIKKEDILKLAQCCGRKSATAMMDNCKQMMQDIRTPSPTLMTSLLVESAGAFAQTNTSVRGSSGIKQAAEKISIVLYGLASISFHDRQKSFELHPMISQIYESINLCHCSLDIQISYANHLMNSSNSTLEQQEHHDSNAMFLFLSILLISVENDDYSRVDTIDRHIHLSIQGSIYPEISLLFKIANARRNLDYNSLKYELEQEMDHLDLQLMNGDVQLLLMTLDKRTRLEYLHRLRQCCILSS